MIISSYSFLGVEDKVWQEFINYFQNRESTDAKNENKAFIRLEHKFVDCIKWKCKMIDAHSRCKFTDCAPASDIFIYYK